MSLKAKIEAVIYASEEPVTLAQLIGLLGQEAQAELDQLDAAQQSLALDEESSEAGADVEGLNSEVIGDETEASSAEAAKSDAEELPAETEVPETAAEAFPEAAVEDAGEEDPEKKTAREAREDKDKARRLRDYFRSLLDQLMADYIRGDRGLEVREVASGYRLATKPEYHDAVRGFVKSLKPPLKLSLQALETLAVVAYKQPITAPEVGEIRGVDSGGVLGSLMTRKLVTTAGRKQVIGRPILYKTTKDFLLRFGLKDINELPSIEEFEKMAGELAEQEEIPMEHTEHTSTEASTVEAEDATAEDAEARPEHHAPETSDELEAQRHTHLPQADGSPDPVDDPLDDELPDDGLDGASEQAEATPVAEADAPVVEAVEEQASQAEEPLDEEHVSEADEPEAELVEPKHE
jgi:segregation and condensation protein B